MSMTRILATLCVPLLVACELKEESAIDAAAPARDTILPYGSWPSPISAASLVASARGISGLNRDGAYLYWLESRPEEGGRTTHDVFSAGASYFGISDIEALAQETHKFESRYLDQLIGPYPERRDLYRERSPIHHLDGFDAPLILLQGLDDPVVPPNQSERIYNALRERGVPTAYVAYEGESHGFRRAENNIHSREAELYFYGRVPGFEPADDLEPIEIDNLPARGSGG